MIRRYTLDDIPQMLDVIEEFLKSSPTYRDIDFHRNKMEMHLRMSAPLKKFFCNVIEVEGQIIGGLCAETYEYTFSREVYGADLLFYITESKRSLRLATALVDSYVAWGKDRRLREVRLASTTGIKTDKFNRLCEHMGFKALGSIYSKEL